MADEKWERIHSAPIPYHPYAQSLSLPRVQRPTCPEHCSGRHETEGLLRCPTCQTPAYRVVAHEWIFTEGSFFYSLIPMNGMAEYVGNGTPSCTCGRQMERVSG